MPPVWTTDISGIAAKFSRSPAAVTRENTSALTGKSANSAETDAASRPAGTLTASDVAPTRARMSGVPARMAAVAP